MEGSVPDFVEKLDPPDKTLIDAVLDGLKQRVVFLVDDDDAEHVEGLVKKTERIAFRALVQQFGDSAARKFFATSENPWILRTTFGGWVFFYPIELLTPQTSMAEIGQPDFVYWPDARGTYARMPFHQWAQLRDAGNIWRPDPSNHGPRSVFERLRDP
jgi:hypothetical protein